MKPFAYVTSIGQVVRSDVLDGYAFKQDVSDSEASKQIADPFEGMYDVHNLAAPLYPPLALARLLELNTYHARACKVKARDTAGLGWQLVPVVDNPSEEQADRVRERLEAFDPPLQTTLTKAQTDFEAIGWGAIEVIREAGSFDGEVVNLRHVPGHEVRVRRFRRRYGKDHALAGEAFAQVVGTKRAWFRPAGAAYEIDVHLGKRSRANSLTPAQRGNELIYWTNYTPRSRYYGLPDITPAIGAITGDVSRRDYNIAFFKTHGVPAWAVFVTGDFDVGEEDPETGKNEIEQQIADHLDEVARSPHSVLTMLLPTREGESEGKIEVRFEKLSAEVKEASFQLYRKDNRDEVLAAHGVDVYRLGIAEVGALGGNTAVEATDVYKMSVIEPRQFDIETLFGKHVISSYEAPDYAWKLENIDTEDEEQELGLLERLHTMGAVSAREVRRRYADRFDLDPEAPIPDEEMPDLASVDAGLKAIADMARGLAQRNGDSGELTEEDLAKLAASA